MVKKRDNRERHPLTFAILLAAALCLGGCDGSTNGDGDPMTGADATADSDGDAVPMYPSTPPPANATRRLSRVELERTIEALTGVSPESLSLIPPDSLGFSYDRVVASQSVSRAHLDAFFEVATEIAETLIREQRLDDIASECADEIVPPLAAEVTAEIIGASLGLNPEWAVEANPDAPTVLITRYAPDPIASYSHDFPLAGRYRITLDVEIDGPITQLEVDVAGALVHTEGVLDGEQSITFTHDLATSGAQVLEYRFITEPDYHNLAITYRMLRVEGPLDVGAETQVAARQACAEAIVDGFAPKAWRRPLTSVERERLLGLHAQGEGAAALRMLLQAILVSPHFLYLIEIGAPIEDTPGVSRLNDWEVAARLSYALCEQPPDDALRAAAAAGELSTPAEIETQARRLLDESCARETITRFFMHWLWLNHLEGLNKSPEAFPGFDDETRLGLQSESQIFIESMFWDDSASLSQFFTASHAWLDPRSAWLWGLSVESQSRVDLPPERRGILTSPGLLAATAPFDTTSPVERGVFVMSQLLCQPLPPPPPELEVAPPLPDPGLTTRERWAQHSSDPGCAGCHVFIDPIGFAFEGYDGVGQHRVEENGLTIDTRGGIEALGIPDGDLTGAVEISAALAESDALAECLATQWLRFTLGRLEGSGDTASVLAVAEVLGSESLREGLIHAMTTEPFFLRHEVSDEP